MPTNQTTESSLELTCVYDDPRHRAEPASLPVHFVAKPRAGQRPTDALLAKASREMAESLGLTAVVAARCKERACAPWGDKGLHAHITGQMPRELALHYMDRCLA